MREKVREQEKELEDNAQHIRVSRECWQSAERSTEESVERVLDLLDMSQERKDEMHDERREADVLKTWT